MKKLFITLVICICVVTSVFIVTRTRTTDNNITVNDNIETTNYDIYQMLEDVKNISNIYVESESNDGSMVKIYVKDNCIKKISENTIVINNMSENTSKSYKTNDKKGIIFNPKYDISTDYTAYCNYILSSKENLEYEITTETYKNEKCIKVIFRNKTTKYISWIVWFNTDNNLIVKIQHGEDESKYTEYLNIQLNTVTDEDFVIPSDVQLTYISTN